MRRDVALTVFGLLGLILMAASSPSSTDKPGGQQAPAKDILGVWTLVHSEMEGDGNASIGNPGGRSTPPRPGAAGEVSAPCICKISKEEIQCGWEHMNFPTFRYQYQLNAGGKKGTIELAPLDKEGKKLDAKALQGIYLLTDDILMMCYALDGAAAPEHFTTAAKSRSVLMIFRRGKEVLAQR